MIKSALEELLYWIVSIFINLIIFTLLSTVFLVKIKEVPEIYPLKVVDIREIEVKEVKQRSAVKSKAVSKKTTASKPAKGKATKAGTSVSKTHSKGDVSVPEERDVSLLAEIQKKVEQKLKQRKVKRKKHVGSLSAVVKEGQIKIKGGTRKVTYVPPPPDLIAREFPSRVSVRIWVDPHGKVIRAILLKRSGNVNIDSAILKFVKGMRFEPIPESEVQVGEITFNFHGG